MTDLTNRLSVEDVEREILHEDKRGRSSHVYKQLLSSLQREAKMREALYNARQILRVENLLDAWPENAKIIDEALRSEYPDVENNSK